MTAMLDAPATVLGADSLPVEISRVMLGHWVDRDPYEISGALPEGQMEAECRICGRRRLVSVNWSGSVLKCTRCDQPRAHEVHYPAFLVGELRWHLAMLERAGFTCMVWGPDATKGARIQIEVHDSGEVDGFFVVHPLLSPTAFLQGLKTLWGAVVARGGISQAYNYRRNDEAGSWWYASSWPIQPGSILV